MVITSGSDSGNPSSNLGRTCMNWICIHTYTSIRDSIVASIPACHAGDRGSIPRRGKYTIVILFVLFRNCPFWTLFTPTSKPNHTYEYLLYFMFLRLSKTTRIPRRLQVRVLTDENLRQSQRKNRAFSFRQNSLPNS